MNYTYQEISESGSFSNPYPDDVKHAKNKTDLRLALARWEYSHYQAGSPEECASLWVCIGTYGDIEYPDFIVGRGPRGGVVFSRA